ncbi:MAG: potassium channel protein [Cytophagales bacterium]|nr:potassium channel protein [Cytophagales bacterium]
MINLSKNKALRIGLQYFAGIVVYLLLVMLLIEVESDSNQSALTNYGNAIWYSLVTLTTVGYGDIFPATLYGRAIGFVFILSSLAFYGLIIGQFTMLMTTIKENRRLGLGGTSFMDHAIIIGWNDFSKLVVDQLMGVKKRVVIVIDNKADIENIQERYPNNIHNIFTLFSDLSNFDLLEKANIHDASIIFVNHGSDTDKLVYILNAKKVYPEAEFMVTLDNGDLKGTFLNAGVSNTISKFEISSKLLASYIFEPDVAVYSESIMSYAKSDSDYDMKQLLVTKTNPFVGHAYQEVFFEMKKRYNSILIGITKRDKYGKKKLIKNPHGEIKIASGDYLLIILNGKAFKLISKLFGVEEGYITNRSS